MTFTSDTKSIVIGGTSGIGKAVAAALQSRGGSVAVASRSTGLDVADETAIIAYFDAYGPVDHVIFTAGSAAPGGAVTDVASEDAKRAFDTKFWGSVAVAKAAAKHIRRGGTITLTSGFLARRTVPGTYVKTAMNAALEATAKILAKELAPIRVNVVSPGLTDTEAYAGMDTAARTAMLQQTAASLPAGKTGTPDDLALGYLFAIENPFVTGAVIDIDGGALIN
ncbi:SDR family oxidoreductase [Sulfitobacter sp.]|uniref:SDR family oxidoreductase n=1 Tax=Sulfitobacter sp. TaxID=1903071 RepID=UPI0030028DB4